MAGDNQNIRVTLDLGDTESQIKNLNGSFEAQTGAIKNLALTAEKLNSNMDVVSQTFRGAAGPLHNVEIQFKGIGDAAKIASVKITENRAAMAAATRDAANLAKEAANLARSQAAAATVAGLRNQFPAPSGATLAQMAQYEARLARIQAAIASGKGGVTAGSVAAIGSAVNNQQVLGGLTPQQTAVQNSLAQLRTAFIDAGGAGKNQLQGLTDAWQRLESIATRFLIRQALFAMIQAIKTGVTNFIELEIRLGQVKTAADGTGLSFSAIGEAVRKISENSGFAQLDVASAALQIFQQRATSASEGLSLLDQAQRLARASATDLHTSTSALVEVLNSYGLSNARAAEISATLFSTAQRGHSTVQQVASAMTQTSQAAQSLGIPVLHLAAFIETLGQHGKNAAQSGQILESILQKLLNPGKELAQVFRDMGVNTGQNAIAQLGLAGTLQAVFERARGNSQVLAELLGTHADLAGIVTSSGQTVSEFGQNLANQDKNAARFNQAVTTTTENVGQQLRAEFTKISNFFTNELGGKFVTSLANITEPMGGLANVVKGLTGSIGLLGLGFVTYKAYSFAASGATVLFSGNISIAEARLAKFTTGANLAATASNRLKGALAVGLSAVGGIASLAVLIPTIIDLYQTLTDKSEKLAAQAEATAAAVHRAYEQINADRAAADRQLLDQFGAATSGLLAQLAAQSLEIDSGIRQAAQQLKEISKGVILSGEAELKPAEFALSRLKSEIAKARADIDASNKAVKTSEATDFGRNTQRNLQFESVPGRQVQQLQAEIAEAERRAQAALARAANAGATPDARREAAEESRRYLEQAEALNRQLESAQVRIRQRAAENGLAPSNQVFDPSTGDTHRVVNVDDIAAQAAARERQIRQIRTQGEAAFRAAQQAFIDAAEKREIDSINRIERARLAIRRFAEFNPINEAGQIRPEFHGATPEASLQLVQREQEQRRAALVAAIGPEAAQRLTSELHLQDSLLTQEQMVRRLFALEQARTANARAQTQAATDLTNATQAQEEAQRAISAAQGRAETAGRSGRDVIGAIQGQLNGLSRGIFGQFADNSPAAVAARAKLQEIRDLQNAINASPTTSANADERSAQVAELRRLVDQFITGLGPQSDQKATNQLSDLRNSVAQQAQAIQAIVDAEARRRSTLAGIRVDLDAITTQMNAIAANRGFQDSIRPFAQAWQDSQQRAQSVYTIMQQIAAINLQQQIPVPPNPGQASVPPAPVPKATGGLIPGFGSGDIVPAMLEPGEFVMRRRAVQQFFPLINALNSGFVPGGASGGNSSVTSVGDITVNLQGGKPSDTSAREIAQAIRREIRRGSISQDQLTN